MSKKNQDNNAKREDPRRDKSKLNTDDKTNSERIDTGSSSKPQRSADKRTK